MQGSERPGALGRGVFHRLLPSNARLARSDFNDSQPSGLPGGFVHERFASSRRS